MSGRLPKAGNLFCNLKICRHGAFRVTQLREVMSHHTIENNGEGLKEQSSFKVVSNMFESVCTRRRNLFSDGEKLHRPIWPSTKNIPLTRSFS